jgi:hypothetical protein
MVGTVDHKAGNGGLTVHIAVGYTFLPAALFSPNFWLE